MRTFNSVFALVALGFLANSASALPVQWAALDGGNDHWYELVLNDGPLTWTDANAASAASTHLGIHGHLATITSAGEQAFLNTLNPENLNAWLGATDTAVEGTWEWITGEAWSFSFWDAGEPNDFDPIAGGEDYLAGWYYTTLGWNDVSDGLYASAHVVEYDMASTVPAPASVFLAFAGVGVFGAAAVRRRKQKRSR